MTVQTALTVKQMQDAVRGLPDEDYIKFRRWIMERDSERWDRQYEEDFEAGRVYTEVGELFGPPTALTVEQLQVATRNLPDDEYGKFGYWVGELDWARWDVELEEDIEAGRLDFLEAEALEDAANGRLRDLPGL